MIWHGNDKEEDLLLMILNYDIFHSFLVLALQLLRYYFDMVADSGLKEETEEDEEEECESNWNAMIQSHNSPPQHQMLTIIIIILPSLSTEDDIVLVVSYCPVPG